MTGAWMIAAVHKLTWRTGGEFGPGLSGFMSRINQTQDKAVKRGGKTLKTTGRTWRQSFRQIGWSFH